MGSNTSDYTTVIESLLPPTTPHPVLSLPVSPRKAHVPSSKITTLSLHPVIESALHIINMDLPSAHFLLRHMQAAPAWEAMYLHGILHRVEGDLDNTRAWYGDVQDSEVFQEVWGGMDFDTPAQKPQAETKDQKSEDGTKQPSESYKKAMAFIDKVEAYKHSLLSNRKRSANGQIAGSQADSDSLSETSISELRRVLSFCERKYGTSPLADASQAWVSMNEKHSDQAAQMITGGEGWRQF